VPGSRPGRSLRRAALRNVSQGRGRTWGGPRVVRNHLESFPDSRETLCSAWPTHPSCGPAGSRELNGGGRGPTSWNAKRAQTPDAREDGGDGPGKCGAGTIVPNSAAGGLHAFSILRTGTGSGANMTRPTLGRRHKPSDVAKQNPPRRAARGAFAQRNPADRDTLNNRYHPDKKSTKNETLASPPGIILPWNGGGASSPASRRDVGRRQDLPRTNFRTKHGISLANERRSTPVSKQWSPCSAQDLPLPQDEVVCEGRGRWSQRAAEPTELQPELQQGCWM